MANGTRKNVSIRDVAKRAGVSIASVSRVVNGDATHVSAKTRSIVQQAVEELDYRPNRIGQALRSQTTDSYALIISNIQNNFFASVAWELERILNETGKAIMFFNSNEDPDLQDRFFDEIRSRQMAGVFLLCAVDSKHLPAMIKLFPTIFINRTVSSVPDVSYVGIDDYAAVRDLTKVILSRNQGRFGVIHGPKSSNTSFRRLQGVLDYCAENGQTIGDGDLFEADLSMEGGYQGAVKLLARRYGSIFCGTDQIAYGVYRRCRELGLSVPEDIRIYGFDDNPLNEWLAPWLDTVRVPHVGYAKSCVQQMQILAAGGPPRDVILPYELVIRS